MRRMARKASTGLPPCNARSVQAIISSTSARLMDSRTSSAVCRSGAMRQQPPRPTVQRHITAHHAADEAGAKPDGPSHIIPRTRATVWPEGDASCPASLRNRRYKRNESPEVPCRSVCADGLASSLDTSDDSRSNTTHMSGCAASPLSGPFCVTLPTAALGPIPVRVLLGIRVSPNAKRLDLGSSCVLGVGDRL